MARDFAFPCRAVLFDCDGVLVDSDAAVERAWKRWALTYSLDPDEVFAMVHGRRSTDTVDLLIEPSHRVEALAMIDRFEVEDAVGVRAIPGAIELVESIPTSSWAIVTSGTRPLATARLKAAGITPPPVLVTAGDVTRGKPSGEGYRAAAEALGIPAVETAVLEDTAAGVLAGRDAGVLAVVGVSARALASDADVVVPDLKSLSWTSTGLAVTTDLLLRKG